MCNVIKSPLTVQAIQYHCIDIIFFIYFIVPYTLCNLKYLFFWSQLHTDCDFALIPISHIWVTLTHVRWIDSSFACCFINLFLWQCASPCIYQYWLSFACTRGFFVSLEFFSVCPRLVYIIMWISCYSKVLNYQERQQPVLHLWDGYLLKSIGQLFDHINWHGISEVNVIWPKNLCQLSIFCVSCSE